MKLHEEIEQNFKKNVQEFSAAKRATKSAQWLCCTFDKAICIYQVSGNSLLTLWILYWGCKLYFSPI